MFQKSCESLLATLSSYDTLCVTDARKPALNKRGRRLLDYLRTRRRRAYLDGLA